jgi:signal transduction histidine kinase
LPFGFIAAMDHLFERISQGEVAWRVKVAQVINSDVTSPEQLPSTGWSNVSFPYQSSGGTIGPVSLWCWTDVNITERQEELWTVYIGAPDGNYAVFVNGIFVAESAPMVRPLPLFYEPLLFKFPGSLLRPGANKIAIRMVRAMPTKTLQQFSVGPASSLTPVYSSMYFYLVSLRAITAIALLMMSATMYTFLKVRASDTALGWFALSFLIWAIHLSVRLNSHWPHGNPYYLANFEGFTIGIYVLSAAVFVQRFVGIKRVLADRIFVAWAALGAAVLFLVPMSFVVYVRAFFDAVWFPPLLLVGVYVNYLMLREYRQHASVKTALLLAIAWCELVVGFVDQLVEMQVLAPRPFYLVYTASMVAFVFAFLLLRRFLQAVDAAERARDGLEVLVRQKTANLEQNLMRIKDMERERALSAERERIMRDMYDSVGGRLVQALAIASRKQEYQPIEEVLQHCLGELRLIVDSIEPVDGDLTTVLGTLRLLMARRLASSGVHVHWNVQDIPVMKNFGPERVLQVVRIIHEAIANVLKHAHAKNLTISVFPQATGTTISEVSQVVIEVSDDGCGSSGHYSVSGHGLKNMQHRAERLGGRLQTDTSRSGTRVTLWVPA